MSGQQPEDAPPTAPFPDIYPSTPPPHHPHISSSHFNLFALKAFSLSATIPGFPLLPKSTTITDYLLKSLSVDTLNALHRHLWWAGRPANIRALHQQLAIRRDIVINEKPYLHLLWYEGTIFIKPLPAYLLSADFFKQHIHRNTDLRKLALGFLRSYTKLIQSPVDLQIAKEKFLVPSDLDWKTWCELATHIMYIPDEEINKRYYYGELRLTRVNHAHRYCYAFPKKYYSQYVTYGQFFRQNFGWLFLAVVYISVILAAQQVLLTTDTGTVPMGRATIVRSSWWFSVLALGGMGVSIVGSVVVVGVSFMYHVVCTIVNLEKWKMDWVLVPKERRKDKPPRGKEEKVVEVVEVVEERERGVRDGDEEMGNGAITNGGTSNVVSFAPGLETQRVVNTCSVGTARARAELGQRLDPAHGGSGSSRLAKRQQLVLEARAVYFSTCDSDMMRKTISGCRILGSVPKRPDRPANGQQIHSPVR
ncbi:hypothetical protein K440DRAFT_640845 [Wilcoxina mikolae CBS 423.85]|nr:hypothetical protein K440DRAFT_640845 [Wilcoxina mikolae CBS 423.85]